MRLRNPKPVVKPLLGLVLLGGFATFVWPTAYRPLEVDLRSSAIAQLAVAARENRFTGRVEFLIPGGGWSTVERPLTGTPVSATARPTSPTTVGRDSLDPLRQLEALTCQGQKRCAHDTSTARGRTTSK
jgi:hypothetical protein